METELFRLFVNRDDIFSRQVFNPQSNRKEFYLEKKQITLLNIKNHLECKEFLGVYQINKDNQIKWICFDFDKNTIEDFENANKLRQYLEEKGFHPLMENSGGGDCKVHLWIFCKQTSASNGLRWANSTCKEAGITPHEIFPKQEKLDENTPYGSLVKLPLGQHLVTKNMSFFFPKEKDTKEILNYHLSNLDTIPEIQAALSIEDKKADIKAATNAVNVVTNHTGNDTLTKVHPYDTFFNFVLNNQLPAGVTVKSNNKKIQGINSNILKNEAIWLFQKGYNITKITQEIKPTFDKMGWSFNDLLGWFKKAEKYKLSEISRGELVQWCKNYYPGLLISLPYENFFLTTKDLVYYTKNVPNIKLIENILKLRGDDYKGIRIGLYDFMVSLAIPEHLKKISLNDLDTDTRIHLLVFMGTGKGKLNIKETARLLLLAFNPNANIKESSVIYKEQFVGKILRKKIEVKVKDKNGNYATNKKGQVITKKKEKPIKKYGSAFADLLILEECFELLTSSEKNEIDTRDLLLKSLDIYGKNIIEKQNIDDMDTDAETIRGYPKGNCIAFCQPLSIPETFVTKGTGRRFIIYYREFPKRTDESLFEEKITLKKDVSKDIAEFADFMRKINSIKTEWEFDEDAVKAIKKYHLYILEQGYIQGGKINNYVSNWDWHFLNQLVKYSCLKAIQHLRTNITIVDVENAFLDIIERLVWEFEFVEKKVSGFFDYGDSWKGASGKKQQALEWLYNNGGTDIATAPSIERFKNEISNIYGITMRRSQDRLKDLTEDGYIETKKPSPTDRKSKVWLTFNPGVEAKQEKKACLNVLKEYNSLIEKKNNEAMVEAIEKDDDKGL